MTVDLNAAAARAQDDIDTYAANAMENTLAPGEMPPAGPPPAPQPLDPPAPGTPGGLPDARTPVSEAPFAPDSAQGAAQVVQTYYAHIEAGDYAKARALWGDYGKASGMTPAQFAAAFAKYSEYHANVGAPEDIEAGAGQRYVTVPVQPYARLRADGTPVYLIGSVTLRRTVIDGAIPEQKSWRISAINVKPAPVH